MSGKNNTYAAARAGGGPVTTEKSSIIYWLVLGFMGIFLFWSPFQRGLFNGLNFDFERPIYSSLVWSSIILFLTAIYFFFIWKIRDHKDLLSISIFLIPLTYTISLATAESHYFATNMVYIQLLYATFFILGVYLTKNKTGNSFISTAFMASGYVVVLFGILKWLGNGAFADKLVSWFAEMTQGTYRDAVMVDSNGLRLTSVFQYANSYAAYLIAIILSSLFFIVKSRKWYSVLPHALMMVPMIVSFWLTLSRGALVILPIVFLVMLFFFSISRQILTLIYLGLSFAASLVILQKVTNDGTVLQKQFSASVSWHGWLLLIVASLAFSGFVLLIQIFIAPRLEKGLSRFSTKKFAAFALPVAAIVVGAIGALLIFGDTSVKNMLPANVKTRLENINFAQHSVLERGTFYKDAVKLWKDYPILGAGGGAWAALYEKYQNNPYTSRQAHNFLLQYLTEVGLLGFLVFVALLIAVFYFYIRSYIRTENKDSHFLFFIVAISLLFHSVIDFDLSYVYLSIILFLALGGMVAGSGSIPVRLKTDRMLVHKSFPAILLVLALISFIISVRLLTANTYYKNSLAVAQKSHDFNEITAPLNNAISMHPNHPDYVLQKVGILLQVYGQTKDEKFFNEAQSLITQLFQKEPHNRLVVLQQLNMYKMKGQMDQALQLVNSQIPEFPWYIDLYENSIALSVDLGNQARTSKNYQVMDKYWNGAFDVYNNVLKRMDQLKNLPKEQLQGREFDITPSIAFSIGELYYLRGDYAAASNILKMRVSDQLDDQTNRLIARWYLAALQKQGQNDQALYDKLIAKDANEKNEILALTAANFALK